MLSKVMNAAVLATILSVGMVQAQSLGRLGGPANLPPSGFDGQQFVDARGCLFMRAGFGANVTWVPRVDRSHKPICGFPPSFGQAVALAVEAAMAPDPQAAPPPVEVASAPAARATPAAQAPAQPASATPAQPRPRQGGGFLASLFAPTARPAAPAAQPVVAVPVVTAPPVRVATIPTPPKGYRLAWTDDRLNPMRGIGTAQGQAQQDQVWTREIPAQLVAATPRAQVARPAGQVTVSTMSAPEPQAPQPRATGQAFVQVGSFGDPANAEGAKARLKALGLPVAVSQITRKGKVLQVVYAGPFTGSDAAQSALAAARGAGFGDALLRMN